MRKEQIDRLLATPHGRLVFAATYGATMLAALELFDVMGDMGRAWVAHRRADRELPAPAAPSLPAWTRADPFEVARGMIRLTEPGTDPLDWAQEVCGGPT